MEEDQPVHLIKTSFKQLEFYRLSRARQPEVRLLEGYRSPLDEGFPPDYYYESGEKLPNNEEDIVDVENNNNDGETSSSSNTLPLCQRECLGKFSEAAKAAIQSSSNFERYRGVCHVKERMAHWAIQSGILDSFMKGALSSLANGEAFATKMLGRQDQGLGILSGNGLHRNAEMLNSVLEGAKRAAAEATAKGIRMAAKAVASKQSLPLGEAGEAVEQPKIGGLNKNLINRPPLVKRLSPDFMRAVVQDGCELARCQLICIRVKFDAKCGGSAGTLLSEAFVRPISQAQEFLSYGSIAPFMGAFLPHQCDFMVKKEVLNEFRIPPELDDALHKKYDIVENNIDNDNSFGEGDGIIVEKMEEQEIIENTEETTGEHEVDVNQEGQIQVVPEETNHNNQSPQQPFQQQTPNNTDSHPNVSPGDLKSVAHVVSRTASRKGPRNY
uniref:Uncharacterized protein n=1 Tax=Meloidogyne floridensis TaxID=298350 RepID=A0A915NZL2_9BILA